MKIEFFKEEIREGFTVSAEMRKGLGGRNESPFICHKCMQKI